MNGEVKGYTIFPNMILDKLMPILSGTEYKVLSVIVKKTLGWRKIWDEISLTQFQNLAGISRESVCKALEHLESYSVIASAKYDNEGERCKNEYALRYPDMEYVERLVESADWSNKLTSQKILLELVNLFGKNPEQLVQKIDTHKNSLKEKKETTGNFFSKTIKGNQDDSTLDSEKIYFQNQDVTSMLDSLHSILNTHPETKTKTRDEVGVYLLEQLNQYGKLAIISELLAFKKEINNKMLDPLVAFSRGCEVELKIIGV